MPSLDSFGRDNESGGCVSSLARSSSISLMPFIPSFSLILESKSPPKSYL